MIHRRSIVYNIQWCGIIYVCTYTRVTHTGVLWCTYEYMQYSEKRKSKIFRGLRPLDPRQGLCPCTPPGALRRAPGPHPKSARAYALAMCAPRTCLPPHFLNPGAGHCSKTAISFNILSVLQILCRYKWHACRLTCTDKFPNVPTKLWKSIIGGGGQPAPLPLWLR